MLQELKKISKESKDKINLIRISRLVIKDKKELAITIQSILKR